MARISLLHFPALSRSAHSPEKIPQQKYTVLEWIRNDYVFPAMPLTVPAHPKFEGVAE